MMTVVSIATFAVAFGIALYAIVGTVVPRIDRIVSALRGQLELAHHPLETLSRAERHIAVRRWAAQSRPASSPARAAA